MHTPPVKPEIAKASLVGRLLISARLHVGKSGPAPRPQLGHGSRIPLLALEEFDDRGKKATDRALANARVTSLAPEMLDLLRVLSGVDLPAMILAKVDEIVRKADGRL